MTIRFTMELQSTLHTIYTRDHEGLPVQHQVAYAQKVRLIQVGGRYELQIVNPETGYIKSFSGLAPEDSEDAAFRFANEEVVVIMQLGQDQDAGRVSAFRVDSLDHSWGLGYE